MDAETGIELHQAPPDGSHQRAGGEVAVAPSTKLTAGQMIRRSLRDRHTVLLIAILLGTILGVVLGFILKESKDSWSAREVMYVNFVGTLFLRMLKMLIVPLVVATLVTGVASLESTASGRLGYVSVIYYMVTTLLAVLLGIFLVAVISPGTISNLDTEGDAAKAKYATVADTLMDLVRNMFPANLIEAAFRSESTIIEVPITELEPRNDTANATDARPDPEACGPDNLYACDYHLEASFRVNVLGLIVASCVLGSILNRLGDKGKPLRDLFESLTEVVIAAVNMVMMVAPIGIMSLIAAQVVRSKDLEKDFAQLAYYMATVITGLAIHGFVVLPLILFIVARRNPILHIKGVLQACITAFATASSSATLPVTMNCVEENLGIDRRVTRFVLPIGATINMDGTALYEAIAVIFIAQASGLSLNFGQYLAISLTATAASVGAAGIPQAGLVTMALVLTAVGLPLDKISIILSIDWFLDRCRTAINVYGDTIGCAIVYRFSKNLLDKIDEETDSGLADSGEDIDGIIDSKEPPNGELNRAYTNENGHRGPEKVEEASEHL